MIKTPKISKWLSAIILKGSRRYGRPYWSPPEGNLSISPTSLYRINGNNVPGNVRLIKNRDNIIQAIGVRSRIEIRYSKRPNDILEVIDERSRSLAAEKLLAFAQQYAFKNLSLDVSSWSIRTFASWITHSDIFSKSMGLELSVTRYEQALLGEEDDGDDGYSTTNSNNE